MLVVSRRDNAQNWNARSPLNCVSGRGNASGSRDRQVLKG